MDIVYRNMEENGDLTNCYWGSCLCLGLFVMEDT